MGHVAPNTGVPAVRMYVRHPWLKGQRRGDVREWLNELGLAVLGCHIRKLSRQADFVFVFVGDETFGKEWAAYLNTFDGVIAQCPPQCKRNEQQTVSPESESSVRPTEAQI